MFTVVFRADASIQIGTGHVMRCLTLADALRPHGAVCRFVCREHEGHMLALIRERGYEATGLADRATAKDVVRSEPLPQHAVWLGADWGVDASQTLEVIGPSAIDWLVVDHYALDARWEAAVRPQCRRLMVIDDLADRSHDCDLLLDQNLGREPQAYRGLVPAECKVLTGSTFALLRPEFSHLREYSLARRASGQLQQILIAMGGVDKDNVTASVLAGFARSSLPPKSHIVVAMGRHAPWITQVQAAAAQMPVPTEVRINVTDIGRTMADSDLAVGAAGTMAWERCSLGLPTLTVVLAANQLQGAQALAAEGAAFLLSPFGEGASALHRALAQVRQPGTLREMQAASARVTDGLGTQRVLDHMTMHHASV